jgi:hypothetical protein
VATSFNKGEIASWVVNYWQVENFTFIYQYFSLHSIILRPICCCIVYITPHTLFILVYASLLAATGLQPFKADQQCSPLSVHTRAVTIKNLSNTRPLDVNNFMLPVYYQIWNQPNTRTYEIAETFA